MLKNSYSRYTFFFLLLLMVSCNDWELKEQSFVGVTTGDFTSSALPTEGIMAGTINGLVNEELVDAHGHIWSLSDNALPTVDNKLGISQLGQIGNNDYVSTTNTLIPGTSYNYRSYVIYGDKEPIYGEVKSFSTDGLSPQLSIDNITASEDDPLLVTISSTISNLTIGLSINSYGIVWGSEPQPTFETDQVVLETEVPVLDNSFSFEQKISLPTGKSYLRLFMLVNGKAYYGESQSYSIGDIWLKKGDFPDSFNPGDEGSIAMSFSIGDKGYFGEIGGRFYEYDPVLNTIIPKANHPGFFGEHLFNIDAKGYVASYNPSEFYEYNSTLDSWTKKTNFPGNVALTGFSIGETGYALEDNEQRFYEYNSQLDEWTQKNDFPGPELLDAVSFTFDAKGYIAGFVATYEYNPALDEWTRKADFDFMDADIRNAPIGFVIGDKGYIGTGFYDTGIQPEVLSDFYEYDLRNDTWTRKADFGGGNRFGNLVFAIGSKGYTGGGSDEFFNIYSDIWEYTPE